MDKLTFTRPDDWHVHLREGEALQMTVRATARCFSRAIAMPNLNRPVDSIAAANTYRKQILAALKPGTDFTPLMTLYLTEDLTPKVIAQAKDADITAVKLYPRGATTGSAHGLDQIKAAYPVFEAMQRAGLPLLIHGEVTDADVDVFDREAVFIDKMLAPLVKDFPELKVVLEHISTASAVAFIKDAPSHVGATITAHHLLLDRNALLAQGLHPHHYCLPIIKTQADREALVQIATSGNPKFFLGTDSAPHTRQAKENTCCAAGIYTAHAAIELYAEVFEQAGALDKLEAFSSFYGPDFYGLPRNTDTITLHKSSWHVPASLNYQHTQLIPFRAGEVIAWALHEDSIKNP